MRHWLVILRDQARNLVHAGAVLGLSAAVAHADTIITSLPYVFVNGQVADASQVNANFNAIVSEVNTSAAASGVNTSISQLLGLITLQASGLVSTTGNMSAAGTGTFGTLVVTGAATVGSETVTGADTVGGLLTASGGATVSGTLTSGTFNGGASTLSSLSVTGATALGGNLSIGGTVTGPVTASGNVAIGGTLNVTGQTTTQAIAASGIAVSGNGSVGGNWGVVGNLIESGIIQTGGAVPDTVYSGPGSIVVAYGDGVRAANTISARGTMGTTGLAGGTFNMASSTNPSTGVYTVTFVQPMQSTAYQVVASSVVVAGSVVSPIVTAKSTTGFTLSYYSASGGSLTSIATINSDIIVSGGN